MRINGIDILKLLPAFMQDDKDIKAIAEAQRVFYNAVLKKLPTISRWGKFDRMSEEELDFFANDFYIPWYKTSDKKEVKVRMLEHFIEVWLGIGTCKSINTMLDDVYGGAVLVEWFNDVENLENGEFSVEVEKFSQMTQANKTELFRLLEMVKRKSQHISSVFNKNVADVDWIAAVRATQYNADKSDFVADVHMPDASADTSQCQGVKALTEFNGVCEMLATIVVRDLEAAVCHYQGVKSHAQNSRASIMVAE